MPVIVALILVVISGLVAAAGDFMGQRAARRKLRIGSLRPRYVSRLIAVLSGILISLATYAALFLLYTDYREALTQYGSVKARYLEAVSGREKAEQATREQQRSLDEIKGQLEQSQAQQIELIKDADAKRREVDELSASVQAKQQELAQKQAQAEKAERELSHTNSLLAGAKADLSKARSDLSVTLGTAANKARELDQLKQGDIIPKDAVLGRVVIPASQVAQRTELLDAELTRIKQRLAAELDTVLDPSSNGTLEKFSAAYPYADPPADGVVHIVVAANVLSGEPVPILFRAQSGERLLAAGELLLTLRVSDGGARITARGRPSREVPFSDGPSPEGMEEALVQCGDEFVAAMLELGFKRPEGTPDEELAGPVLAIAGLGRELFERERPYVVQLATTRALAADQWPEAVTVNVFKEPGS